MTAAQGAIWHDVECGGYEADLALWEELAERRGGPVLELGCGTGRVSLHLARRGHRVFGLDRDPALIEVLANRAAESRHSGVGRDSDAVRGGDVVPIAGDACEFELREPAALALAPMQLLQLLPDGAARRACLNKVAASLEPGGLLAAAIVERMPHAQGALPPLPDVREVDGWIYSSLPTAIAGVGGGEIVLRRLRQIVSPEGTLSEETNEIHLHMVGADELEGEAEAAGFAPVGRRAIPETEAHVGSTAVLLEKVS